MQKAIRQLSYGFASGKNKYANAVSLHDFGNICRTLVGCVAHFHSKPWGKQRINSGQQPQSTIVEAEIGLQLDYDILFLVNGLHGFESHNKVVGLDFRNNLTERRIAFQRSLFISV